MDYATTHHHRGSHARRKTAAVTLQKARGIRGVYAASQRRRRGTTGYLATCPGSTATDGFLRAVFPATLKENKTLRDCREQQRIGEGFRASFAQLTAHYGIALPLPEDFRYPETIKIYLPLLKDRLKGEVKDFYGLRFVKGKETAFLVSEERYSTGQSLYYIPILPLYKMLRDKAHRKAATLLLSIGAWLYRIVDVPYYRQECSYLHYQYEMIGDWVEQDTDNDYAEDEIQDILAATTLGDVMEQKLRHPANLDRFAKRLARFRAEDTLDSKCLAVATEAHALFVEYPQESLFRNEPQRQEEKEKEEDEDEDDGGYYDNETITMDKYVSFSADTEGWLFDTLADTVNNEFNECGEVEEPRLLKCFDGTPVTGSFDFERRVFDLMDRLCDILYNYKMQ
jgi:hypothetical protein